MSGSWLILFPWLKVTQEWIFTPVLSHSHKNNPVPVLCLVLCVPRPLQRGKSVGSWGWRRVPRCGITFKKYPVVESLFRLPLSTTQMTISLYLYWINFYFYGISMFKASSSFYFYCKIFIGFGIFSIYPCQGCVLVYWRCRNTHASLYLFVKHSPFSL